jgi:hypothetical protein
MERHGSQAVGHAIGLQARLTEIQQKAELRVGCFVVVDALGSMCLVQHFHGFQLDQEHLRDRQVHALLADRYAVIDDRDNALLHDGESRLAQFMGQSIPTSPEIPTPSRLSTVNAQPITSPDSSFSRFPSACICVHLLLICVKTFFLRCCQQMIAQKR